MLAEGNEFDDDIDEEEDKNSGNAVMSIFASYYGIEDETKKFSLSIDSPQFDANQYVTDLLSNQDIEHVTARNLNLIQEIRTLDSDMQMLVYENYNKFISATETIKRMKSNVEAMDDDLESVRSKMNKITEISASLDASLSDKRIKVDKLVRVKRLLGKLEFLSELPEKLEELIDRGQYKRAVQLYRRTISVLTKHSHLLSFKNIKERTERMMSELRSKVLLLLDDTSFEAVKLTHYAAILRLMEAPRDKVLEKLLQAHRTKTLRVMAEYHNHATSSSALLSVGSSKAVTSSTATTTTTSSTSFSLPSAALTGSVANARKFHQTIIVGLVEACKGLSELFEAISLSDPQQQQTSPQPTVRAVDGKSSSTTNVANKYTATATAVTKTVPKPTAESIAALKQAAEEEKKKDVREKIAACEKLQQMVNEICPQYKEHMLHSLTQFFDRFNNHTQYYQQLEDDMASGNSNNNSSNNNNASATATTPTRTVRSNSTNPFASDDNDADAGGDNNDNNSDKNPFGSHGDNNEEDDDGDKSGLSQAEMHRRIVNKETKSATHTLRTAQLKLFDLDEEKQSWLLLSRQMILDWDFFDKSLAACYPSDDELALLLKTGGEGSAAGMSTESSDVKHQSGSSISSSTHIHATEFAEAIMEVLENQVRFQFDYVTLQAVQELLQRTQEISMLADVVAEVQKINNNTRMEDDSTSLSSLGSIRTGGAAAGSKTPQKQSQHQQQGYSSHHSSTYNESMAVKSLIQRKSADTRNIMEEMVNSVLTHFTKICTEAKSVLDVYTAVSSREPLLNHHHSTTSSGSNRNHEASKKKEMNSNRNNNNNDRHVRMNLLGADLLWHFIHRLCRLLEICCDVGYNSNYFSLHSSSVNKSQQFHSGVSGGGSGGEMASTDYEYGFIYDALADTESSRPWLTDLPTGILFTSIAAGGSSKSNSKNKQSPASTTTSASTAAALGVMDRKKQEAAKTATASAGGTSTTLKTSFSMDDCLVKLWQNIITTQKNAVATTAITATPTKDLTGLLLFAFLKRQLILQSFSATAQQQQQQQSLVNRLLEELKTVALYPYEKEEIVRDRCLMRIDNASRSMLIRFVELTAITHSCHFVASLLTTSAQSAVDDDNDGFSNNRDGGTTVAAVSVSESALSVALTMDTVIATCCIVLGESVPQPRGAMHSYERGGGGSHQNRHGAGGGGGRQSMASGVQLDIERLFSQRIQIFDPAAICIGSGDVIAGAVIKSVLKGALEHCRLSNFETTQYRSNHASITFLKQMGNALLKEGISSEVDRLADQALMALYSRYVYSNDISMAQDNTENQQINRAVTDAVMSAVRNAVFIQR